MDLSPLKTPYVSLEETAKEVAEAHADIGATIAEHAATAAAKRSEAHDALHALRLSQGNTYK